MPVDIVVVLVLEILDGVLLGKSAFTPVRSALLTPRVSTVRPASPATAYPVSIVKLEDRKPRLIASSGVRTRQVVIRWPFTRSSAVTAPIGPVLVCITSTQEG